MNALFRTLESALHPIGIIWLALICGAVIMARARRRRSVVFFSSLALFLWLAAGTPLHSILLASLERPYLAATVAKAPIADVVIVLGGITAVPSPEPFGFSIHSGVGRLITGVELVREGKAPVLALGGGAKRVGSETKAEGELLKSLLDKWSVAPGEIIPLRPSRNTREEALRFHALMQQRNWTNAILVSSAYHLRRAAATFRKAGVSVSPVASDFIGIPASRGSGHGFQLIPTSERLRDISIYLHECAGMLYYRIRGWT